jgi:hypothetical protein
MVIRLTFKFNITESSTTKIYYSPYILLFKFNIINKEYQRLYFEVLMLYLQ